MEYSTIFLVLTLVIALAVAAVTLIQFISAVLLHLLGHREESLSKTVKSFFEGRGFMWLRILLFTGIFLGVPFLFMLFGIWGLLAGVPILLAVLLIFIYLRTTKSKLTHTETPSGYYCTCQNELLAIVMVKHSGKTKFLYYICYTCKKKY